MSRIPSRDTIPERKVRSLLHRMGYRFRLHGRRLPGRPDIILPKYQTVVFVHGCFWHRHPQCRFSYTPRSNQDFWRAKFRANQLRDRKVERQLRETDWNVIVVWECEVRRPEVLAKRLARLLG